MVKAIAIPDADEASLVQAAQGTSPHATEALDCLIRQHRPLMRRIVTRLHVQPQDREDAMQSAILGLIIAVKRFNPAKGVRLTSFAFKYMKGQVIADVFFGEGSSSGSLEASRDPANSESTHKKELSPIDLDPVADLAIARDLTSRLIAVLNPFEAVVLAHRYHGWASCASVARTLGTHPKRVSRALHRVLLATQEVMIVSNAA